MRVNVNRGPISRFIGKFAFATLLINAGMAMVPHSMGGATIDEIISRLPFILIFFVVSVIAVSFWEGWIEFDS